MLSRARRVARHTVLLVGEGKTEWAFLRHIKSLYISRGCGVSAKILNARGRGPNQVVSYAIKQCMHAAYDRAAVLLDTDLEMSAATRKRARSKSIRLIETTPCFEGLLLKILGEHESNTCAECKTRARNMLPTPLTTPDNYQADFPRDVLEERRHGVPELDALLDCISFDN